MEPAPAKPVKLPSSLVNLPVTGGLARVTSVTFTADPSYYVSCSEAHGLEPQEDYFDFASCNHVWVPYGPYIKYAYDCDADDPQGGDLREFRKCKTMCLTHMDLCPCSIEHRYVQFREQTRIKSDGSGTVTPPLKRKQAECPLAPKKPDPPRPLKRYVVSSTEGISSETPTKAISVKPAASFRGEPDSSDSDIEPTQPLSQEKVVPIKVEPAYSG